MLADGHQEDAHRPLTTRTDAVSWRSDVRLHRPGWPRKSPVNVGAAAPRDFQLAGREKRIISANCGQSLSTSGVPPVGTKEAVNSQLPQETPDAGSVSRSCARPANSKSLTEKAKKAAKMAGFSRLFSPMSSLSSPKIGQGGL